MRYQGGCHCGAVRFELEAPEHLECHECNCSICSMTGYVHLIVPRANFNLLTDKDQLTTYTFNTGVAQHYFCKRCGIKSFYVPRSNPDGVSINVRCLDSRPENLTIVPFDGKNWEKHAEELHHLSKTDQETTL